MSEPMRRVFSRRAFVTAAACGPFAFAGRAGAEDRAAAGRSILIVGDSMIAGGLGLYLQRDLKRDHGYDARRHGKSSSGLARPDFYDWEDVAAEIVEGAGPTDAAVVMFGGNDVQGLYMGHGDWIRWPDEGWAAEYAARVVRFADIVAPGERPLFWIGMPVMRPEKFHRKVQRVNTIYRAEMAIRRNAWFIDTWRLLADEHGNYVDRLELPPGPGADPSTPRTRVRVRAGDGIHLSPAGARYVADHVEAFVVDTLARTWGESE